MDTGRKSDGKFEELMHRLRKESAEKMAKLEPAADTESNSLIGYDLGLCVADILNGKIDEKWVLKIFVTELSSEWNKLISDCRKIVWKQNPDNDEAIARRLIDVGKVETKESAEVSGFGWKSVAGAKKFKKNEFEEGNID